MDYSIFAMQVTRRMQSPRDPLHERLHRLISGEPERVTAGQRYRFYRKLSTELLPAVGEFEKGVWDYWDVPSRAPGDFQDWVDGLQGREARSSPAPDDGEPRYMVFTMSLLLQHGSTSDVRMTSHCNIPELQLWRWSTFEHLLKGITLLNFLNVQSDVVYLLPGDDAGYGLTAENLGSQDYHYLRNLHR
ncbi:hypothetical protein [Hyalangium rubrum]|uniref:Uncharacterized protein n=1 Tax=Hyalangium rubrum TaxID=3103134 RepID=A0ABU5H659_9BACT|nr:hypothetical protein [Hyalangium sp. s54d21]MDY7228791.1 hypothetical protein [Hyalangium sp. s54d21]